MYFEIMYVQFGDCPNFIFRSARAICLHLKSHSPPKIEPGSLHKNTSYYNTSVTPETKYQ